MSEPTSAAVSCAECRRYAEPPFKPLYNMFGVRSRRVVCLDCFDAILHPQGTRVADDQMSERQTPGSEGA